MKFEINYRKKTVKNTNTWRLNSALLNNQEITEEIKEEIKKYIETNGKRHLQGDLISYSHTILHIYLLGKGTVVFEWV